MTAGLQSPHFNISPFFSRNSSVEAGMADSIPQVSVVNQKDIRIVEFTSNKILDETNIVEIGHTLAH